MPDDENSDKDDFRKGLRQVGRYGVVGLLNTAIDFTLTNVLVITTGASGPASLFMISFTACLIATLNSYRLNKSWTFGLHGHDLPRSTFVKYVAVAFLAMMVNTSVFLFVYQFLTDQMLVSRLVGINVAKLVAVGTASIVAFLGYRISVFRPAAIEAFRGDYRFRTEGKTYSFATQLGMVVLLSLLARALFLMITTAVYGEATNYGWMAQALANGEWQQAQSGWTNLFCFWEALFYLMGFSPIQSAIAASFVPGVLLVVPVTWAARYMYNDRVAWLAGALTALHPRLIAYSGNGFAETFSLLGMSAGVAILAVSGLYAIRYLYLIAAGAALGAYSAVNNEGLIFLVIVLVGIWIFRLRVKRRGLHNSSTWVTAPMKSTGALLLGCGLLLVSFSGLSGYTLGDSGLFNRTSIFEKSYSEQLDPQSSAREIYGVEGVSTTGHWVDTSTMTHFISVLKRLPGNLLHTLRSAPGVFLTPFWFFAFLLPLFVRSTNSSLLPEWPWIAMLVFPFVAYPLLYIESRYLFPAIFPVHLFGAAGLVALTAFVGRRGYSVYFLPAIVGSVLVASVLITVWRGRQIEAGYEYNRVLAGWIDHNIPKNEIIVGCGYGFVSTTGFLAQRHTINRLIFYDPKKIEEFVRDRHAHWLILYESFIVRVNPELLRTLDRGMPDMEMVFQTKDNLGRRIQIYHLNASHSFHRGAIEIDNLP